LSFNEFIALLKSNADDILRLLKDSNSEREVLEILSSYLNCNRGVEIRTFPTLIVDLLYDNIAVEVEFNKSPHEGLHQAIAYKVFLGIDSMLMHVLNYSTDAFKVAFRKILLICITKLKHDHLEEYQWRIKRCNSLSKSKRYYRNPTIKSQKVLINC